MERRKQLKAEKNTESINESRHTEHHLFPMFVDMTNKNVVVIGGGAIATRRIKTLLQFGCKIKVIADSLHPDLYDIEASFQWTNRQYKPGDVEKADIVIAATNDRKVNAAVADECRKYGVAVNVVDCKEECDFYFPAIAINKDVVAGIGSNGKNPALTKEVADVVRKALAQMESL